MALFELDDQSLERIVRSEMGWHSEIRRVATGHGNPISIVIETAEEMSGQPAAVFWVDDGFPESFSLPLLNPPIVIFSTSYLQLVATLHEILVGDVPEGLISDATEGVLLRIVAELLLRRGEPALACYFLAKSVADYSLYVPSVDMMTLEMWNLDETYMSVWFHALLHELGHAFVENHDLTMPPLIDTLVERIAIGLHGEEEGGELLRLASSTRGHSLDPEILMREVNADSFAVQCLFFSTVKMLNGFSLPQKFSPARFCTEVMEMFTLHHSMMSFAKVAQICADFDFSALDPFAAIAARVRFNAITRLLARLMISNGWEVADDIAEVEGYVESLYDYFNGERRWARVGPFEEAQRKVGDECLNPAQRDLQMMSRLADKLGTIQGLVLASMEIDRFSAFARSLDIKHPDLDLLMAIRAEPSKAATILRAAQRPFYVLRVLSNDQPVVLKSHNGLVTFVFLSEDMAMKYRWKFQLWFSHRLRVTAIESPAEHNVTVILHQQLKDARVHIVFEGSNAFRLCANALKDRTFWSTPQSGLH